MPDYEKLSGNLLMRTVENEKDIARYAEFNAVYNNAFEGATCECLLRHHPHTRYSDFQIIENEESKGIVSTTCLIPWTCMYDGVPLDTAMLEMVLTHAEYRKLGLVKAQINRFHKTVVERKFDLGIIWGIPYYYRQYGYTYCINGNSSDTLPVRHIPDRNEYGRQYNLRKAEIEDIPKLTELYARSVNNLQVYVPRSAEYWEYLIKRAMFPVSLIENKSDCSIAGYVILHRQKDNCRLHVSEYGLAAPETALDLLQLLKTEVSEEIVISWPENGPLLKLARSLGSTPSAGGQWLLRIPDIAVFLNKISPVLEKRLAGSDCSGITEDFTINLFRQAYILRIRKGKLESAESAGFIDSSMGADGGQLCIPPDAFVRLVFGFRTLDELYDAWPDIVVKPEARHLTDILFPKMASYINAPYHYLG